MSAVFSAHSNVARSIATLKLKVHREEHDSRSVVCTEQHGSDSREWFTVPRHRFQDESASGSRFRNKHWGWALCGSAGKLQRRSEDPEDQYPAGKHWRVSSKS